jgi:hypothetical protein
MACENPECVCPDCNCIECDCTEDNPCNCAESN